MKRRYIFGLVIVSYTLGALFANIFVSYRFKVGEYTPWGTYMSNSLKFSIEYPKNLVPKETHYEEGYDDGSFTVAGGLVEWAPFPNVVPVVSIMVNRLPEPVEWVRLQPVEKYWNSPGENRAGARIYHGEKMYSIDIENLNPQYAERMIKSIKFLK